MENFTFYAPTYFAFGKDTENDTGKYVKRFGGNRVLLHYGGGSVIHSGLLDRVKKSLDGDCYFGRYRNSVKRFAESKRGKCICMLS